MLRLKGALACGLVALMVLPASAMKVGYTYEDGSDAIFRMDPNIREVFEATIAGELEKIGSRITSARRNDSEIANFKGLVHPHYPNGKVDDTYICGWVRGVGEITGQEFVPFLYMRNGGDFHATIFVSDEDRDSLVRQGCAKALGIEN